MKYITLKDKGRRQSFEKLEQRFVFNRSLVKNSSFAFIAKQKFFNRLAKSNSQFQKFSITRIRNRCVLSGRSRSLIRFFRISRIKFREYASSGRLFGVQKASW